MNTAGIARLRAASAYGHAHRDDEGQMIEADDRMSETGQKALHEGLRRAAPHDMMRLRR